MVRYIGGDICWISSHYYFCIDKNVMGLVAINLDENVIISIKISLKCVSRGPINYIPALVQIMACRRPGGKPFWINEC